MQFSFCVILYFKFSTHAPVNPPSVQMILGKSKKFPSHSILQKSRIVKWMLKVIAKNLHLFSPSMSKWGHLLSNRDKIWKDILSIHSWAYNFVSYQSWFCWLKSIFNSKYNMKVQITGIFRVRISIALQKSITS